MENLINKVDQLRIEIRKIKNEIDESKCKTFEEYLIVLLWYGKESMIDNAEGDNLMSIACHLKEIQKMYPGTKIEDIEKFLNNDKRIEHLEFQGTKYYYLK